MTKKIILTILILLTGSLILIGIFIFLKKDSVTPTETFKEDRLKFNNFGPPVTN